MRERDEPASVPRIEARGVQYGWLVLDLLYNLFGSSPASAKGPRVVAIDRHGNERVIEECPSKREARRRAEALRAEIAETGPKAWSVRRDLPGSFW
jgi:hypothetical protein